MADARTRNPPIWPVVLAARKTGKMTEGSVVAVGREGVATPTSGAPYGEHGRDRYLLLPVSLWCYTRTSACCP